jgi:hypothetical protein
VSKKTKKSIKLRKKNLTEKTKPWKKNRLEFLKNWPVWFWFYKPEIKKTKPEKKNQAKPGKPSQTGKSRAKPEKNQAGRFEPMFSQNNQTEPNRN